MKFPQNSKFNEFCLWMLRMVYLKGISSHFFYFEYVDFWPCIDLPDPEVVSAYEFVMRIGNFFLFFLNFQITTITAALIIILSPLTWEYYLNTFVVSLKFSAFKMFQWEFSFLFSIIIYINKQNLFNLSILDVMSMRARLQKPYFDAKYQLLPRMLFYFY